MNTMMRSSILLSTTGICQKHVSKMMIPASIMAPSPSSLNDILLPSKSQTSTTSTRLSSTSSTPTKKVLTRGDIIDMVASKNEIPKAKAKIIVSDIFDSIAESIANNEVVRIANFGRFSSVKWAARTGINPRTTERIEIPEQNRVKFKSYRALKDSLSED